jgi:hypothetical protein
MPLVVTGNLDELSLLCALEQRDFDLLETLTVPPPHTPRGVFLLPGENPEER